MHVNEIVTNKILEQLEKGSIPWHKPWFSGMPQNPITKTEYTGINPWLLNMTAEVNNYQSPYWLTENGIKEIGGRVPRDVYRSKTKAGMVIFAARVGKKTEKTEEDKKTDPGYFMMRFYNVYNLDTIKGADPVKLAKYIPERENEEIPDAQAIVDSSKVEIRTNAIRAYYSPKEDYISLPPRQQFKSSPGYYATAFHEMIHSTGHESRLNRFKSNDSVNFGSELYSKEELVAELGSAYLMNHCKLEHIEQSTAYIQGWLGRLKNDKNFVISASSQANKAYQLIIRE